jgi:hypothetical protein
VPLTQGVTCLIVILKLAMLVSLAEVDKGGVTPYGVPQLAKYRGVK